MVNANYFKNRNEKYILMNPKKRKILLKMLAMRNFQQIEDNNEDEDDYDNEDEDEDEYGEYDEDYALEEGKERGAGLDFLLDGTSSLTC